MSRIICFSYERLFYPEGILSGPGSRIWEFARALQKKGHEVTIAELDHNKDYTKERINFISWDTLSLSTIEKDFDVAFILLSAFVDKYFEKIKKIPTVVDLTTPISIEAQAHTIGEKDDFFLHEGIIPTKIALERGDFFICANEEQRNFYLGMMSILGIKSFNEDIISVARFAPRKQKPKLKNKKILKKIVGKNKQVLLWLGSIFSWYDYKTPIKAMKKVSKSNKDAVLVFAGGLNPNTPELTKKNFEDAKEFAKKQNLLGKNVFFMDWVPYKDRLNLYAETELCIITSRSTPEADICYRTRLVDSLNARIPVICTKNDYLSKIVESNNLGETVQVGQHNELANKILELLRNKNKLEKLKKKIDVFVKREFNIDKTITALDDYCRNPIERKNKTRLDFYSVIEKQRERIKDLEYMKDDKIAINKNLINEIKHLELRFEDLAREKQQFEKDYQDKFKKQKEVIGEQAEIIERQYQIIGRFKSSIIYPFYKLTHSFGKTRLGKLLQKLLK